MGRAPAPHDDEERLEQRLLEEMHNAEKAYRLAIAERKRVTAEYGAMLDHPDGAHALHQSVKNERVALENYTRALKAFSDLVVHERSPTVPGDHAA